MIIIKLEGGLGNQMFQYAFAKILAKINDDSVLINKIFFHSKERKSEFTPRNFELGIFNNSYIETLDSDLKLFTRLSNLNKLKKKFGLNYPKEYKEASFDFQKNALSIKTPVYLKGLFQSYKYFIGFENYIKEIFTFPVDTLDNTNKELLFKLKKENTISIHIRRGDYISNKLTQQYHGNCSLAYYMDSISLLTSKIDDFTLVFFSDDSDWVKEQLKDLPYSMMFIDHNKDQNSWIDMFLMSSCHHNIIANSSFSWWAAWLNENPQKIVIAPKNWFAKTELEINTKDLIPSEWIRL